MPFLCSAERRAISGIVPLDLRPESFLENEVETQPASPALLRDFLLLSGRALVINTSGFVGK